MLICVFGLLKYNNPPNKTKVILFKCYEVSPYVLVTQICQITGSQLGEQQLCKRAVIICGTAELCPVTNQLNNLNTHCTDFLGDCVLKTSDWFH